MEAHKAENLSDDDRRRLATRSKSGQRMLGPLEWEDCGHGKHRIYRWVWETDSDVESGDVDVVESPDCAVCCPPDDDMLENPVRNPYAEVESLLPCRGCGAPLPKGYRAWMSDHFGGWFCQKACDMAARRRAARATGRAVKPGPWKAKPGRVANPPHPRGALIPIEAQERHGLDHLGRPRKNPHENSIWSALGVDEGDHRALERAIRSRTSARSPREVDRDLTGRVERMLSKLEKMGDAKYRRPDQAMVGPSQAEIDRLIRESLGLEAENLRLWSERHGRKAEPRKPEPRKPEPRKPEPRRPEPRRPEPRKPEPRKPEPRKPEPRKPEPRPEPQLMVPVPSPPTSPSVTGRRKRRDEILSAAEERGYRTRYSDDGYESLGDGQRRRGRLPSDDDGVWNPRRNAVCPDCGAKDAYVGLRGQLECPCTQLDLTQAFDAAVNADAQGNDVDFVRFASVWAHRLHGSRKAGEAAIEETMRVDGADSRIEALRIMVFG